MSWRAGAVVAAGLLVSGCATNGALRRVETQVAVLRAETARQDSARASELARIIRLSQANVDSLSRTFAALEAALRGSGAAVQTELLEVQRLLLQLEQATGQNRAQVAELTNDLQRRIDAAKIQNRAQADSAVRRDSVNQSNTPEPSAASASEMFTAALNQHQRGSVKTAREAFREFLATYPSHPNAVDAVYYIGETFETEAPDSAVAQFNDVVSRFPAARRASGALFKLGLIADKRGDKAGARAHFQKLIDKYPQSDEATLARERIKNLKP